MGLLEALFGGSHETKIENLKRKKRVREIAAYLNVDDNNIKQKALDALYELANSGKLAPEMEEAVVELIDPLTNIREKREIDKIEDVDKLREVAVNQYFAKRQCDMAIYTLKKALERKQGDSTLMNNLAAAHSLNDDFDSAREIWDKILEKESSNTTARDNYVKALLMNARKKLDKEPDSEGAVALLLKALELNQTNVEILYELAEYYMKNKKYDKAAYYYKKCLANAEAPRIYSGLPEFRGNVCRKLGEALHHLAEIDEAIAYYEESLSIYNWNDTDRVLIQNKIERLRKG